MSVEDESVVDIISTNEPQSTAVLTVSDHLDWLDTVQHETLLQAKLTRYLAFVERGEIAGTLPCSKGLSCLVFLASKSLRGISVIYRFASYGVSRH